jgi:hypothetical protein
LLVRADHEKHIQVSLIVHANKRSQDEPETRYAVFIYLIPPKRIVGQCLVQGDGHDEGELAVVA